MRQLRLGHLVGSVNGLLTAAAAALISQCFVSLWASCHDVEAKCCLTGEKNGARPGALQLATMLSVVGSAGLATVTY